jgi:hypothetical protein
MPACWLAVSRLADTAAVGLPTLTAQNLRSAGACLMAADRYGSGWAGRTAYEPPRYILGCQVCAAMVAWMKDSASGVSILKE